MNREPLLERSLATFYDLDSTRISHLEYWWGTKTPLVLIGWLLKWLRIRIPGSTDDPNVESTLPFQTTDLPPHIAPMLTPLATQLATMGFTDTVYHVIQDPGTRTTLYWATLRHVSGRHFARIHYRVWHQGTVTRPLFPMFFTAFTDGTFLVSSSGKPDMLTPPEVQMNRMDGASVVDLWAAHERILTEKFWKNAAPPVRTRDDLISLTERHHVLLRDFNLARGVFRPRSEKKQTEANAFAAAVARSQELGHQYPEVLAEIEYKQVKKARWGNTTLILVVSLIAFLGVGVAQWDWKFTLAIVPVLFIHEAGHWLAMKVFRYRNLRMFFLPFFGAAVAGRNRNAPGWKKAIVALAGPLPGIGLGTAVGIAGLVAKQDLLIDAGLLMLFLNGFNLLPVLPLDGGHTLHAVLFCRNRWLDFAFRVAAAAVMVLMGIAGMGQLFAFIAILLVLGLPLTFKLGKVTDSLRRQNLHPPLPVEGFIPSSTAQAIISAVKAELPKASTKMVAAHTLNVFETLNARPPGPLTTLAILSAYGGALLCTLVFSMLLFVGRRGGLG